MTNSRKRLIIDTDPGGDDMQAILIALGSENLEIEAITTVAGNVGIENTTRNALRILELGRAERIPVHAGASQAIGGGKVRATEVHGVDGLCGSTMPEPQGRPASEDAVGFLVETLRNAPRESVYLAVLGPMTNVALALRQEPSISSALAEIVVMGGAFGEYEGVPSSGNITPYAEFNIHVDAVAADVVARSGVPMTWFPLDLTHQALADSRHIEMFRNVPGIGEQVAGVLVAYGEFDRKQWNIDSAPIHDAHVTAYLADPSIYRLEEGVVEVVVEEEGRLGQTVFHRRVGGVHNVATGLDMERFFQLALSTMTNVGQRSEQAL